MCFSHVTWLACSLIIWGQLFFVCIPFVKAKVKQIARQVTPEAILHVSPLLKASVCLTAHCFICLREITTFCKFIYLFFFNSQWSPWNIILTQGLCYFSFSLFACLVFIRWGSGRSQQLLQRLGNGRHFKTPSFHLQPQQHCHLHLSPSIQAVSEN